MNNAVRILSRLTVRNLSTPINQHYFRYATSCCSPLVQQYHRVIYSNHESKILGTSRNGVVSLNLQRFFTTGLPKDKIGDEKNVTETPSEEKPPEEKLTLFQKFKKMYREYWYVLIPVHCVTSAVWFGTFYYLAVLGVDIVPLLEKLGASESIINTMTNTGAGYIAVAYGMYKIATPARYTVTLGGTTITINYLRKWGYITPIPSREKMTEIIKEKGRDLKRTRAKVLAKMNLRRKVSSSTQNNKQP